MSADEIAMPEGFRAEASEEAWSGAWKGANHWICTVVGPLACSCVVLCFPFLPWAHEWQPGPRSCSGLAGSFTPMCLSLIHI